MSRVLLASIFLAALSACSGDPEPVAQPDAGPGSDAAAAITDAAVPQPDAGGADAAPNTPDASSAGLDAGPADLVEHEPNNGSTGTEFNAFPVPGRATGLINPATDVDILGAQLQAGELWSWKLSGPSGRLVPRMAVFDSALDAPSMIAVAPQTATAEQEHFVLETGLWFIGVADRTDSGSDQHDWVLTAERIQRTPTPVSVPSTINAALPQRHAIALYSLHVASPLAFDVEVFAERNDPASNMDTRLSIFDANSRTWIGTNDDQSGTVDSKLGSDALPAGDYVVILENIDAQATVLTYRLVLTAR